MLKAQIDTLKEVTRKEEEKATELEMKSRYFIVNFKIEEKADTSSQKLLGRVVSESGHFAAIFPRVGPFSNNLV